MIDFLNVIYERIKNNSVISLKVADRIKFYEYDYYEDESKPFIVLRPLNAVSPDLYGNDHSLREVQDIQIDVQACNRLDCKEIMQAIEYELEQIDFRQLNGDTLDEYFSSVRRFCLAKRFRCKTKIN